MTNIVSSIISFRFNFKPIYWPNRYIAQSCSYIFIFSTKPIQDIPVRMSCSNWRRQTGIVDDDDTSSGNLIWRRLKQVNNWQTMRLSWEQISKRHLAKKTEEVRIVILLSSSKPFCNECQIGSRWMNKIYELLLSLVSFLFPDNLYTLYKRAYLLFEYDCIFTRNLLK